MKQNSPDLKSNVFEVKFKIKTFEMTLKVQKAWIISLAITFIKMVIKLWLSHH